MFVIRGVKGWIVGLAVLAAVILILFLVLQLFILILPLIIIIAIVSYLFRMLNKVKKEQPKDYINVKYKVKK
jgi:hypothetical protein